MFVTKIIISASALNWNAMEGGGGVGDRKVEHHWRCCLNYPDHLFYNDSYSQRCTDKFWAWHPEPIPQQRGDISHIHPRERVPTCEKLSKESKNCVIFISQKLLKTYLWIWRSVIRLYIGKSNQMSQAVDRSCIWIHDVKKEVCLRESLRPYDLFFF